MVDAVNTSAKFYHHDSAVPKTYASLGSQCFLTWYFHLHFDCFGHHRWFISSHNQCWVLMGGLLVSKFFDCDTPVMSNIKPLVKIPYTLSPLVESLGLIEQCCIIQPVQQCDIKEMADWPVASCWSLNLGWRSTCDWTHSCYTQGSQIRILEATSNMILYKVGWLHKVAGWKKSFPLCHLCSSWVQAQI